MDYQVEAGEDGAAIAGMSTEMEPSFVEDGSGRRVREAAANISGRTRQYVDIEAAAEDEGPSASGGSRSAN